MALKSMWLVFLMSCVISTEVLDATIVRPSCATGWFYHGPYCYGYFRKLRNWSEAELECQSYGNGAHLASVLNLKEASTIAKYIRAYQRNKPVWIGLHDPQKKHHWQWVDGAVYIYRSLSGKSVGENKYCAVMNAKTNFLTWTSKECDERQHFLCKYRP
ncbi:PREDICTED: regenerating islet-derived protein 4 [Bison bison bison]|uniref:Regenerating islet-derived protein 4 n=3 Tax=Bovinae TaxID=27592 RepID=A0A6P3H2D6_BISBB|nr:PREDICTED: regenerating islet-derived protein 4 [Bos mutus]XP_010832745.1 PREDICTED: regenerating islet-derived protein 4 [Bison bison bison]ELR56721.1 Regenerating islet-derived protein 4 [Bos mutus]